MAEKMRPARGIYLGQLRRRTGELLLIRRRQSNAIVPDTSFFGNWELPGGAVLVPDHPVSYNYYLFELKRVVKEKAGIIMMNIPGLPVMHSLLFLGKEGWDESSVIPMIGNLDVNIGEFMWVDPDTLHDLALTFKPADEKAGISGEGLLSGYGKRMHCMSLVTLSKSPNQEYAAKAFQMLNEIVKYW